MIKLSKASFKVRVAMFAPNPGQPQPPQGFTQILLDNGIPQEQVYQLWDQGMQMAMQSGQSPSQMTPAMINDIASLVLRNYQGQNPNVQLPIQAKRRFASGLRRALLGR